MSFLYNNYSRLKGLIFITCLVFPGSILAKNINLNRYISVQDTLKGTVIDISGKPIPGTQIRIIGKLTKTTTGTSGAFAIPVSLNDQLCFTRNGFYNLFYPVSTTVKKVLIRLNETFLPLADTINVLYGKRTAGSIVGAVNTINTGQLTTSPTQSLLPALSGLMPGLNIGQTSGYPGADGDGQALTGNISTSIRGYTGKTVSGNELLVLIDGAIRPYNSISPEEIESVTLLKDAISTVMLGQRSTPGMLLITTKKGQNGTTRMSFSAQTAVQTPLNFPKTLSAYDYANLYDQTQINNGVAAGSVKYSAAALNAYQSGSNPYLFPDVNWKNTILKNTTTQNKYNFNIQGASPGIRFFVAMDYLKDNGLFNTSAANSYNTSPDYSRYSGRANVSVDFNKTLKLDIGAYGRVQDQTQPGNNDAQGILNGIFTTPALAYPVNNPNGTYGGNSTYQTNLYARAVQTGYSLVNTKDLSFDFGLTQKLDKYLPGLYIKGDGNVNVSNQYLTNRYKTYAVVPVSAAASGSGYTYGTAIGSNTDIGIPTTSTTTGASGGAALYRQTSTYVEGLAGYDHQFGPGTLSAKLVADQQQTARNQDLPYIYNTFAGDVAYSYKQKYFVEASGSYGSFNQFAPSHQYEPFYAAGIGWNIAQEDIIKNNLNWISNLKVRVNYGKTGYVNRGSYAYFAYLQRYASTGTYYFFGSSATGYQGYAESGIANADAEGEKAKKLNAGFDIGLFKDHLSLTADYFKNDLYDIWILPGGTLQVLGSGGTLENIGKQNYTGTEFTATFKNNVKNFNYFIGVNLSVVQTKQVYSAEAPAAYSYQLATGLPIGTFSGLTAIGIFRSQAEINAAALPSDVPISSVKPGDIRYLDRNNDGVIDSKDVGPVGSTKPQIFYGATLGFNYKGFDLNMLIQGVQNRQVYLSGDYEWAFRNNGLNNAYQQNLNAYSPSNPDANYPRLTIGTNVNNEKTSTFWLHNAGFARLKNAQIGYTLPSAWTMKVRIPSARIFVNGENLLTVSQLNDFGVKMDPEVQGANYPLQRVINFGINIKL